MNVALASLARACVLAAALAAGLGAARAETATATFAGGCFWCMQGPFDDLPGVVRTTAGYTGGTKDKPTYAQVSAGGTGHFEAVQVTYDPAIAFSDLFRSENAS